MKPKALISPLGKRVSALDRGPALVEVVEELGVEELVDEVA
jgi:hypothetical protein